MTLKIGVLLDNLGPNQLASSVIRTGAKAAQNGIDVIAYYERQALPCLPLPIASMHVTEAFGHEGILVATSLSTAVRVAEAPTAAGRFFYVWELEWVRGRFAYRALSQVYRDPRLTLLARSLDHARVLESAWNRPVRCVVDDFCLEQLLACLN